MDAHGPLTPTRREALKQVSCGFGYLAFLGLCSDGARAGATTTTHFKPRAKRIIFLFMQGGPSQVDTFDPKERLGSEHGKDLEFHVARTRKVTPEKVLRSPWSFARHGECGQPVSELLPHISRHVDDLCFIKSMHTEGVAHGPSTLFLHTGATQLTRPSFGSWISYGLGSENQNLPAFVTLSPTRRMGGPRNYSSAFLPARHQGSVFGAATRPATDIRIPNLGNPRLTTRERKERFALLEALNREQIERASDRNRLDGVIESFELARRMEKSAPGLFDLSAESRATRNLYGIDEPHTDDFGRQCLIARRLSETGVRFVQVNYADNKFTPRWDQHSNLPKHAVHARATDKPVAGLLADLKARGLLEDTLLWWGGEFGRTPFAQDHGTGRDHNPKGFTIWLAGAGVKPGHSHGATDEFGYEAVEDRVHMHDLHATLLHILGVDHERLTYRHAGRDFRLTDVHGRVVDEILS